MFLFTVVVVGSAFCSVDGKEKEITREQKEEIKKIRDGLRYPGKNPDSESESLRIGKTFEQLGQLLGKDFDTCGVKITTSIPHLDVHTNFNFNLYNGNVEDKLVITSKRNNRVTLQTTDTINTSAYDISRSEDILFVRKSSVEESKGNKIEMNNHVVERERSDFRKQLDMWFERILGK
jgi:hypothetical protein